MQLKLSLSKLMNLGLKMLKNIDNQIFYLLESQDLSFWLKESVNQISLLVTKSWLCIYAILHPDILELKRYK